MYASVAHLQRWAAAVAAGVEGAADVVVRALGHPVGTDHGQGLRVKVHGDADVVLVVVRAGKGLFQVERGMLVT